MGKVLGQQGSLLPATAWQLRNPTTQVLVFAQWKMPKRAELPHCEAEADDAVVVSRGVVDAISHPAALRIAEPTAAAQHAVRAFCTTCPFPYIAAHVV